MCFFNALTCDATCDGYVTVKKGTKKNMKSVVILLYTGQTSHKPKTNIGKGGRGELDIFKPFQILWPRLSENELLTPHTLIAVNDLLSAGESSNLI